MSLFKTTPPGMDKDGKITKPIEPTKEQLAFEIAQAEERIRLRKGLPFLYGWKWYAWAREFFESTNHICLLTAANQISKSSTQIRKCLDWATNKEKWPTLWRNTPKQFWYLYPTKDVVNAEWETKWLQFMPAGEFKDDSEYGWELIKKGSDVAGIRFNSGVVLFFKTYEQNVMALQTGTVDALFCDEELPFHLYEELMFRISASDGYFNMVFTATLGQDEWRRAMEPTQEEVRAGKVFLPEAFKRTISLYDAMFYEDGTPSHNTKEHIAKLAARCSTHNEYLKRIMGRFIVAGGRKYEAFDFKRHIKEKHPIPPGWLIYAGADIGSGGKEGHPSALCYVAVSPNFRQGRVFLGWRGDNEDTTAGDVVVKHKEIKKDKKFWCTEQRYDWANKDFFNIATRNNESFLPADKSHEKGEDVINTLFKNDMLFIYNDDELMKLAGELSTLLKSTNKKVAKDDFCDALRYAVATVPWDWSAITGAPSEMDEKPEEELTFEQREIKARREAMEDNHQEQQAYIEDEFNEWNEAYG